MTPPAPHAALSGLEALAHLTALVQHCSPRAVAAGPDWARFLVEQLPDFDRPLDSIQLAARLQAAFRDIKPRLRVGSSSFPDVPAPWPAGEREATFVLHLPFNDAERQQLYPPQLVTAWLDDLCVQEVEVQDLPVVGSVRVPFPGIQPQTYALPGGLLATLPVVLPGRLDVVTPALAAFTPELQLEPRDPLTRTASVMLLWGKLKHLYPYWPELNVDWDATLRGTLRRLPEVRDDKGFVALLEELLAHLRDAHVFVRPSHLGRHPAQALPFCLEWLDGQLLITNAEAGTELELGAELLALDEEDALTLFRSYAARASGTPEVRRYRACTRLVGREEAQTVRVRWRALDGAMRESVLQTRPGREPLPERRPPPLSVREDGVGYLDWTRAGADRLPELRTLLDRVRVLVVDARGYPTDLPMTFLTWVAREPMGLPALLVPLVTARAGPMRFKDIARPWFRASAVPLDLPLLFLTNAHRTQSYAESLLSIAEAYRLGRRVGSRSAGCNGMVATLELPSGQRVRWTGVKTLRGGGRPLFGVGVPADVEVRRTRAGVAAGRDEVLEAALSEARSIR